MNQDIKPDYKVIHPIDNIKVIKIIFLFSIAIIFVVALFVELNNRFDITFDSQDDIMIALGGAEFGEDKACEVIQELYFLSNKQAELIQALDIDTNDSNISCGTCVSPIYKVYKKGDNK